ncbi:putative U-box domain-containing protein 42 [Platanthera guangdongensis]|uniref:U-box domain-containing protein 42 n=1 Tax=Platanthera guangdongensis TaxID=2320717 RepID=A0ABR2MJI2_9ASPA
MGKTLPFAGAPRSFPDLVSDVLDSVEEAAAGVLAPALPLLERLKPILLDLRHRESPTPLSIRKALDSLQSVLQQSFALVKKPTGPSASAIGMIEDSVRDVGRCLGLLLLACPDAPLESKEAMGTLQREMMAANLDSWKGGDECGGGGREAYGGEIAQDIEDVVLIIKRGEDDQLGGALTVLEIMIGDGLVGEEDIVGVIQALLNRLGSAKHGYRLRIIVILRKLADINDDNKEIMANSEALSNIVKSLSRDVEESREAVALLLHLGDVLKFRQRIGRAKGCIMMLVALLNGADPSSSRDAGKLLGALSSNTQNVLLMAEAGFFVPLVQYLKEGSDMNKILMATAISRMELTDQMKTTLGEEGSIELLVKMFNSGKMEAKLSSLNAIKNLSCSKENDERLVNSGLVSHLLQILFSVTSVLLTLREPAAAILANLAKSESFLPKKDAAQQILSLLNLSSPEIQVHLLHALSSITGHPGAKKIRAKMKESEAMQILTPFLVTGKDEIRIAALSLLLNLSRYFDGVFSEQLGEFYLIVIVRLISRTRNEMEKSTALGIISNIPVNDKKATQILMNANLLPLLITLTTANTAAATTPARASQLDSIAAIMVRFTVPSDKQLQKVSAGHGIIPCLIKLLSANSIAAKSCAATALAQLSQNTVSLSRSKASSWFCTPEKPCRVHGGRCLVRSTFCLVKAGALPPLVEILQGEERDADEAVLGALSTLLQDEIFESGSEAVEEAAGVQAIMRILQIGSLKAQEKAIWMLERVFRNGGQKSKYVEVAQNLLIDLALKGDPVLKPMIGKILAHLQLLEMQSSYF